MRIRDVEAYALRAPLGGGTYWGAASWESTGDGEVAVAANARFRPVYDEGCATTIIRIRDDAGTVGYGEAKAPVAPTIVRDIVNELIRPKLVGLDPRDLLPTWDALYGLNLLRGHSSGFFMEAIAGVDIALWDLVGKALGQSVSHLLGGRYRQAIPVYASGVPGLRAEDDDPGRVRTAVAQFAAEGYRGVKLGIGHGVALDLRSITVANEAVAGRCAVMADAAGRYDLIQARELVCQLKPGSIHWLEAPLPPEQREAYAELARLSPVPITTDLLVNRWQYLDYLLARAVHVVQPDVCRAGGFSECRRIAVLAEAMGIRCVPHMSVGSVVHIAASAHLAATLPYVTMMEFWTGESPLTGSDTGVALRPEDGFLAVPDGPGLGLELDEQALLRYAVDR